MHAQDGGGTIHLPGELERPPELRDALVRAADVG